MWEDECNVGLNNISGQQWPAYLHLLHRVMVKLKLISEGRGGWINGRMYDGQWGWGTGDVRANGMHWRVWSWLWSKPWKTQTLCVAELELQLSVIQGSQLLPAPGALELPVHSQSSQARADWFNVLFLFYFFFTFHFLPSIDRADRNLASQLSSVPIWSEYIWKETFEYICFLKMRVEKAWS